MTTKLCCPTLEVTNLVNRVFSSNFNMFDDTTKGFINDVAKILQDNPKKQNLILQNLDSSIKSKDIFEASEFFLMLKDPNFLKILLVLTIKKFTWNRELRNSFALSKHYTERVLQKLLNFHLIEARQYYELDEISQEVLFKIMPDFKKWLNSHPIIYVLSSKGQEWMSLIEAQLKTHLFEEGENAELFKEILERSYAIRKSYNEIEYLENNTISRQVSSPYEDVIYEKPTRIQKEVKEALKEIAQEKNKGQLVEQREKKEMQEYRKVVMGQRKPFTTYRGHRVHKLPDNYELSEEEREIERRVEQRQEQFKQESKELKEATLQKAVCPENKKAVFDEGLNFLEELEESIKE